MTTAFKLHSAKTRSSDEELVENSMPVVFAGIPDSPTRPIHLRRIRGAFVMLFVLSALGLKPTTAEAQYTMQQCTWVLNQQSQAFKDGASKKIISLERQYLSFCREFMRAEEYAPHLAGLAAGLNGDNQPGEALAIANRCLQMSPEDLPCRSEKANALYLLGRLSEAKSLIEKSLSLAAITDLDAAAKRFLQSLLNWVNAAASAPQGAIDFSEFAEPGGAQSRPSISCRTTIDAAGRRRTTCD